MRDPLLKAVKDFLEPRLAVGRPVLLGYSGGPDSKALLHLVLECRRFFAVDLHLAHVDHGWREESGHEACVLQQEAADLGISFHLETLPPGTFREGNLEEQGRLYRMKFFSSVYHQEGCQALLLGHQEGDLAETVLKRLFEGAPLYTLGGFTQSAQYEGMQILRPLLHHPKERLIAWLEKRGMPYFVDPTNESARFLRGRMRTDLLPFLNKTFGKNISKNLKTLAEEAASVKEFFVQLNHPLCVALGVYRQATELHLKPHLPLPSLQLRFLLKSWVEQHQVALPREILAGLSAALLDSGPKRIFKTKAATFVVVKQNISICLESK